MNRLAITAIPIAVFAAASVQAEEPAPTMAELLKMKAQLDDERKQLDAQRVRLQALEEALLDQIRAAGVTRPTGTQVAQATSAPAPAPAPSSDPAGLVQPVGEAPKEPERQPEVAVLADQGGVITSAGRVTVEGALEYARADRNRVIFRGIEVPQSVLVGVFNISESRQDVLTAALTTRFGLTNRFELNGRVPFIYRADKSILAPVRVNPQDPDGTAVLDDESADGKGIGDIEFGARYQVTNGTGGWPFLIAGVQAVAPTGSDPFKVKRRPDGVAREAATGAGFWGITPSVTALLPTDPAVLFGSLGYTFNFSRGVNRRLNDDVLISHVDPGDSVSASAGIGISLNQRTSISFAYAHNWSFGTVTTGTATVRTPIGDRVTEPFTTKLRDLQLGRFLFGVSYRTSPRTTINWNVEMGATDDATDLRTTLRVPVTLGL